MLLLKVALTAALAGLGVNANNEWHNCNKCLVRLPLLVPTDTLALLVFGWPRPCIQYYSVPSPLSFLLGCMD